MGTIILLPLASHSVQDMDATQRVTNYRHDIGLVKTFGQVPEAQPSHHPKPEEGNTNYERRLLQEGKSSI